MSTQNENTPPVENNTTNTTTTQVDDSGNTVNTTVASTDFNKDGVIDLVKTDTVTVDPANNVVGSSVDINTKVINEKLVNELNLIAPSTGSAELLRQIQELQTGIKCSDMQHIGSLGDYLTLFQTTQEYINNVGDKSIDLVIDTSVLDAFAEQADIYSKMFVEVTKQFQEISTVDDTSVLTKMLADMQKISEMYKNIQKFHASITGVNYLQLPTSIQTSSEILQSVISSIECSMPYINYFADNTTTLTPEQLENATMSSSQRSQIDVAVKSLQLWMTMVQNDSTTAMNGNLYVQAFKNQIAKFSDLTTQLRSANTKLAERLAKWKAGNFV
jgi:hypothetical protein